MLSLWDFIDLDEIGVELEGGSSTCPHQRNFF
jgi:hypothetical protein